MDESKLTEALKTKFEGVSDDILGRVADKIAATASDEGDALAKAQAVTLQRLIESYGDRRANESALTAVRNYEKSQAEKARNAADAKTDEAKAQKAKPADEAKTPDSMPEWARELAEQSRALAKRLDEMDGRKRTDDRRAVIEEATKSLPRYAKAAYARTPTEGLSDEQFAKLVSDIKSEVEQWAAEAQRKGGVFGTPMNAVNGGRNAKADDKEVAEVLKRLKI